MASINIENASKKLEDNGLLTQTSRLSLASESRTVELADINNISDDPVFSCFLIDESGSMTPYKNEVIEGQSEMIEILRKSDKCKKGSLFVVQYLFSNNVKTLNEFKKLSATGEDDVVILKKGNYYNPDNSTALYHSLFYMLQDIAANYNYASCEGVKSSFTVGVITDGEDTDGGTQPEDIKKIIQELISRGILRSSVIVGLTNPHFTEEMLNELKNRLGFENAISLSQSEPRDIRRAFVLASQSAVSGQLRQ